MRQGRKAAAVSSRVESELARNAEVLPPPALEEYREALRIYQEIAQSAR